jgi:hypothetical protein
MRAPDSTLDRHLRSAALLTAVGLVLLLATGVAACGGDDQAADSSPTSADSPTATATPTPSEASPAPDETMTASPSPTTEPETPKPVWAFLKGQSYRDWERAPGWQKRMATDSPHSSAKEVFIDAATVAALAAGDSLPAGATIAKDGYDASGQFAIVAAMQRLPGDGWFFTEYRADGTVVAEGDNVPLCTQCHQGNDSGVLAFPVK